MIHQTTCLTLLTGNRCKDECLPEETNRRIVDIISDVIMMLVAGEELYAMTISERIFDLLEKRGVSQKDVGA